MTYKTFIASILNDRGNFGITEGYKERHHILPRCQGGTDEKQNLIDLTAQEHYEAHRLLALENPTNYGLQLAWFSFSLKGHNGHANLIQITADDYARLKLNFSKAMSTKVSNETYNKRQVICLETGEVFKSIQAAMRKLNAVGASSNIAKSCKDLTRTAYGYHWQYWFEDYIWENQPEQLIYQHPTQGKAVICIETDKEYKNKSVAATELNKLGIKIFAGNIGECCLGKRKTAGGYHWKYK